MEYLDEKILGWVKENGMNANKETTYLDVWVWLLEEKRIYIYVTADCDDWYYNEFEVSIFVHKKTYKDSIVEPTALERVYSSPLDAIKAAINWLYDSAYDVNYHVNPVVG